MSDPIGMARTEASILLRQRALMERLEERCQRYEDALEEIAELQAKDEHGFVMLPTVKVLQQRAKIALGYPPDSAA